MLKKLLFGIAIVGALYCQSQGISGSAISFLKLDQEDEFIISPAVKLERNNHTWDFGPSLLFSFGDQVEERQALKLTGLVVSYAHFLHGKEAKWNLFHSFDFVAQRIKDTQDSQYFDSESNAFVPNEIKQIDKSLFLSANAGILLNLTDKLGLSQSIGIGANIVFRDTESSIDSFSDTFFRQKWLLKTSFNYRIGN
ncbi:hypothetical protein [Ekhidna sp.]|uniref:hypothetical protein n=1 Tax=Ekhidna sp. TaxID=2608089 RepID=UPI003CCC2995